MSEPGSHQKPTDEAIDLVIWLQNDPDNPVAIEMVRAWRARGPEHDRVWAHVAKVHGAAGKILTGHRRAKGRESLGLTRRNFVIGTTTEFRAVHNWNAARGSFFTNEDELSGNAVMVRVETVFRHRRPLQPPRSRQQRAVSGDRGTRPQGASGGTARSGRGIGKSIRIGSEA